MERSVGGGFLSFWSRADKQVITMPFILLWYDLAVWPFAAYAKSRDE